MSCRPFDDSSLVYCLLPDDLLFDALFDVKAVKVMPFLRGLEKMKMLLIKKLQEVLQMLDPWL